MRLVTTELPERSVLVRFFMNKDKVFSHSIVVHESQDRKVLTLYGLSAGRPLPSSVWRKAKKELYPEATTIRWERRKEGISHWRELKI